MSETKFAEGPWHLEEEANGYRAVSAPHAKPPHFKLARVVWRMDDDDRSPQQEASAHLIAAAPDLYTALDRLLKYMGDDKEQPDPFAPPEWNDLTAQARAALAKARGE